MGRLATKSRAFRYRLFRCDPCQSLVSFEDEQGPLDLRSTALISECSISTPNPSL